MKSKYIILMFMMLIPVLSSSQEYKDCENPLILCGDSPFSIDITQGIGDPDQGIQSSCVGTEYNSIWISFSITEQGQMVFTLTPDNESQDLDFILFKMNNGCNDKEIIRCMASGQSVGTDSTIVANCTGSTGLAFGETDLVETAGCSEMDNNFLAPVDAFEDDIYLLMVNDFSLSGNGFQLSFGGSASINCITTHTNELSQTNELFSVYPSISNGQVTLRAKSKFSDECQLLVYNTNGTLIKIVTDLKGYEHDIDLTGNIPGLYYFNLIDNRKVQVQRMIILN
ncbi:MAG: T9SS type A sorting domain-containing protein [Bacteroidia bacterium]|nr:T9SS type A sorting domain-containing protein [Bacteroidia bacterium]